MIGTQDVRRFEEGFSVGETGLRFPPLGAGVSIGLCRYVFVDFLMQTRGVFLVLII